MESPVKAASSLHDYSVSNKFKGEIVVPDKCFGVFFSELDENELNYIYCEINKLKMKHLDYFFYLFSPFIERYYNYFYEPNILNKNNKRSWALPLLNHNLEKELFNKLETFVTTPKHEKYLLSKNKKVHIANEESFVLNFGGLIDKIL